MSRDPFAVLGLPAQPELTDDEVRAAWRRIATASRMIRATGRPRRTQPRRLRRRPGRSAQASRRPVTVRNSV